MTKTDELMERVFAIAAYDMVYSPQWDELHTAIAQALAEAPEPVAWMQVSPGETNVEFGVPRKEIPSNNSGGWDYLPLYDRPPKAEPVPEPLTNEEISEALNLLNEADDAVEAFRDIARIYGMRSKAEPEAREEALTAANRMMRAAIRLEEQAQPAPEPVAWRWSESDGQHWFAWTAKWDNHERAKELGCLIEYAHPPKAEPAPELTDDEIEAVIKDLNRKLSGIQGWGLLSVARAVLKAQKEKQA